MTFLSIPRQQRKCHPQTSLWDRPGKILHLSRLPFLLPNRKIPNSNRVPSRWIRGTTPQSWVSPSPWGRLYCFWTSWLSLPCTTRRISGDTMSIGGVALSAQPPTTWPMLRKRKSCPSKWSTLTWIMSVSPSIHTRWFFGPPAPQIIL